MKIVFQIWTVHSINHRSVYDVYKKPSSIPLALTVNVE
jgi:hypothetical protein